LGQTHTQERKNARQHGYHPLFRGPVAAPYHVRCIHLLSDPLRKGLANAHMVPPSKPSPKAGIFHQSAKPA
jgi:hypothetical protein